uniref:Uncharacterized protein n=1 Tax=Lutzomyia longipalpis TaxID=7200 RepID=A0A1B0CNZ6_LUTLO
MPQGPHPGMSMPPQGPPMPPMGYQPHNMPPNAVSPTHSLFHGRNFYDLDKLIKGQDNASQRTYPNNSATEHVSSTNDFITKAICPCQGDFNGDYGIFEFCHNATVNWGAIEEGSTAPDSCVEFLVNGIQADGHQELPIHG